jgi:hypothetical protein
MRRCVRSLLIRAPLHILLAGTFVYLLLIEIPRREAAWELRALTERADVEHRCWDVIGKTLAVSLDIRQHIQEALRLLHDQAAGPHTPAPETPPK